jgi:tetratricopeptide (TPR) repeat protein
LINILIKKGDLFDVDAERYAQVTYGNLRDKKNGMDQEGEEVSNGAYNLARVIYRQNGDLIKAEELAREALRIRDHLYGNSHNNVGISIDLLARILRAQKNLGDETRELFEHSLAIDIRNGGPDGINTAVGNLNIGNFCRQLAGIQSTIDSKRTQLLLVKSHYEEALRIDLKVYGPNHPDTVDVTSQLTSVLRELS